MPDRLTRIPQEKDLKLVRDLLQYIGENPEREGLRETPARFLKAWVEYTQGYSEKPEDILKVFEDGAERVDEMVIVRDIPVYSLCEHHLAPFFGKAHVGYVPAKKILGLSVRGAGGAPRPDFKQSAIRNSFTLLPIIPYVGGLLAFIAYVVIAVTINGSPTKQGKHDELAGGTQVVKS